MQFKKIKYKDLSQKIISHILSLTERGFDDIIIDGNKTQELLKNRPSNDTMSFSAMTSFILRHSEILKSPIIFDNCHLQIGYNKDDIRQFIPRNQRKIWLTKNFPILFSIYNKSLNE
ncbi:ArsC/Spx/MgsR family protein [Lactococcus sp. dk322]|uniref:ArsC/Spx/MgsR family protein n=1 Tax=Lactococcus sp. dk322 TaxID=2603290 RepID=UPI0011C7E7A6|nr:hypothetical protein FVP43_11565 [Lactococcus sp. dk322]